VVLLLAPVLEPQFITFAVARHLARRGRTGAAGPAAVLSAGYWRMVLAGAGIYVGTEWAFPKLFTETLGHGLYPSALMRQAADIGGVPGLTFVLMIANECVLATLLAIFQPTVPMRSPGNSLPGGNLRQALVPLACAGALVLGLLAYGAVRIRQFSGDGPGGGAVTAGVVQADISQYGRLAAEMGTFDAVRMILDAHFALSAQALEGGDLDLLVWPETVYPTTFGAPKSEEGAAFDREIGAFVSRSGVPLVFGAYDAEGGEEFNAALFLEPAADGQVTFDAYRKASLFPLTERVPGVFESEWLRRWLPWLGTWKAGRGPWVLPPARGL
jgi:apolipoprotein N-acyltransferase